MGWLAGGREGDPEAFPFLLEGVLKTVSVMSMVAIIINTNYKLKIIK